MKNNDPNNENCANIHGIHGLFEDNLEETIVLWLVIIDSSNDAFLGIQVCLKFSVIKSKKY